MTFKKEIICSAESINAETGHKPGFLSLFICTSVHPKHKYIHKYLDKIYY